MHLAQHQTWYCNHVHLNLDAQGLSRLQRIGQIDGLPDRLTCRLPDRLYSNSACNERVVSLPRASAVSALVAASCSRNLSGTCEACLP